MIGHRLIDNESGISVTRGIGATPTVVRAEGLAAGRTHAATIEIVAPAVRGTAAKSEVSAEVAFTVAPPSSPPRIASGL